MKGDFWYLSRKFCLETTIMGLKYFYLYPDRISRCFWLMNMLGMVSLACLLTWLLYMRFNEMPTRITIENQYEPLQNLPYPAVILCSPNQVTTSFMRHFNKTLVDGNLTIDLERVLPKLLGFYEHVTNVDINDLIQLQSLLDLNRYTVPEVMAAIPQSCESFLKLCFFRRVMYTNCATLFSPILTTHGLCCAFNSVYQYKDKRNVRDPFFNIINASRPGFHDGLVVVADYDPEDALDGTILNAGAAKVMFTDHTEFPADDESSLIETNVESYHDIHATHTYCSDDVKALPVSSRKCYLEDEYKLPHFRSYHNSDCDLTCYVLAVQDACHCSLFYMPRLKPELTCNLTSIPCIMHVKARMGEWLTAAQCDCPRECESRRYRVDMSIGNLDAIPYMAINPFHGITFNKSTSIMNFFFRNSVYMKQKQETVMSLISLASNLGGVFGLCLGCSGISVLEILFYVYIVIRNSIKRKFRRACVAQDIEFYKWEIVGTARRPTRSVQIVTHFQNTTTSDAFCG